MNNRFEEQPIENHSSAEEDRTFDEHGVNSNPAASLIEQSNFYNIPELHEATAAIIEGLTDTDQSQLKLAWVEYARITERIVESTEDTKEKPKAYASAQIQAIIHKSFIFQSAGNTLRYLEELDRAEVYAYNENLDEMSTVINDEITRTIES